MTNAKVGVREIVGVRDVTYWRARERERQQEIKRSLRALEEGLQVNEMMIECWTEDDRIAFARWVAAVERNLRKEGFTFSETADVEGFTWGPMTDHRSSSKYRELPRAPSSLASDSEIPSRVRTTACRRVLPPTRKWRSRPDAAQARSSRSGRTGSPAP